MTDVTEWLEEQLKAAGLSEAEMRQAGSIESGTLSNAKARNRVGPELAKQIARGLGKPQAWVFFQLGILDTDPDEVLSQIDVTTMDIVQMLTNRTEAEKLAVRAAIAAMLENLERGLDGRTDSRRSGNATRSNTAGS